MVGNKKEAEFQTAIDEYEQKILRETYVKYLSAVNGFDYCNAARGEECDCESEEKVACSDYQRSKWARNKS